MIAPVRMRRTNGRSRRRQSEPPLGTQPQCAPLPCTTGSESALTVHLFGGVTVGLFVLVFDTNNHHGCSGRWQLGQGFSERNDQFFILGLQMLLYLDRFAQDRLGIFEGVFGSLV